MQCVSCVLAFSFFSAAGPNDFGYDTMRCTVPVITVVRRRQKRQNQLIHVSGGGTRSGSGCSIPRRAVITTVLPTSRTAVLFSTHNVVETTR